MYRKTKSCTIRVKRQTQLKYDKNINISLTNTERCQVLKSYTILTDDKYLPEVILRRGNY